MRHPLWSRVAKMTRPRVAMAAILVGVVGLGLGSYIRQDIKIGDLDPGAPELRPDSRYNRDNDFMNKNFMSSSDVFVIMVKTPEERTGEYPTMVAIDRLGWMLEHLPGVQGVSSLASSTKRVMAGLNEGDLRFMSLSRDQVTLDAAAARVLDPTIQNNEGSLTMIKVYLDDHKAETLEGVVGLVEKFAAENNTETAQFLMAAGSAGIEAATNIEVEKAQLLMTVLVYATIFIVCVITFKSILAASCVVLPLYLTSVLCEAMMTKLGIGVKVATLPVIAVGVGIGVDYGIYMYNKLKYYLEVEGHDLETAYYHALNTTGSAVCFTGIVLSIGVGTWAFSPIKFQADMGILLTFMFLVNMIGAIIFMPALTSMLVWGKRRRIEQKTKACAPVTETA